MARIDCVVLTGFLGSGKTTVLNAVLKSPLSSGTAVLINEIGAVGIDQLVLTEVADNMQLLESGCLCCTLTGSLRETLFDIISTARKHGHPISRIVIETTGLAEPLPILHSLLGDKAITDLIRLDRVVATVDAFNGLQQLRRHPECARQIAAADVAIITKTDIATPDQVQGIRHEIREINALATHFETTNGVGVDTLLLTPANKIVHDFYSDGYSLNVTAKSTASDSYPTTSLQTAITRAQDDETTLQAESYLGNTVSYHQRVRTESLSITGPIYWAGIAAWWNLLINEYGEDLLRVKGLVHITDAAQPYAFIQGVGKYFHPPQHVDTWPGTSSDSLIVCIGVGLNCEWLDQSIHALKIDEPGLLPHCL